MSILKKTESIFKWIILGITLAHLVSYFMPIYESVYQSSSRDPETNLIYLYGSGSSPLIIVNFTNLLIPIVALVFLFANFKNSKLFFYGFSATYILNCIFTTLNLSNAINNNTSSYYEYSFQYGYYIFIVTMVFLALAIIGAFVTYLILEHKEFEPEAEQKEQAHHDSKIDILRKRVELLGDLKNQGILTECEYDEKRAEIIKELKI